MKFQILIIAMLLATVYTQAVAAKKPVVKAKVAVKAPKVAVKVAAKPAIKAKVGLKVAAKPVVKAKVGLKLKVPKVAIKIGAKGKTGAKVTVKAAPKIDLTGSCPSAKMFKSLTVLPKPIAYTQQKMCTGLKSGCCSEDSLNNFKAAWPTWLKRKSAWFWTLSKWPVALIAILKNIRKDTKCGMPSLKDAGKMLKKTGAKIAAAGKKFGLKIKAGAKSAFNATKKFGLKIKAGAKSAVAATKKVGLAAKAGFKAGLKVKVAAPKLKVKVAAKKNVRILQAMKAKVGVKVAVPKAKVSIKVPKVGLAIKAGAKKFAAGAKKVGLKIKAGAKASVAATKKFGLKVKAGAKKFGLKVKAGAKAALASTKKFGLKVKAGVKKFALKVKGGLKLKTNLKIKVKKALVTKPSQYMKGTVCGPLFNTAWNMIMPFMRMRKAAATVGLKCFKAVAKARSAAVCAACDNTSGAKFASGKQWSGPAMTAIVENCVPFTSWVNSAIKPAGSIFAFAALTSRRRVTTTNFAWYTAGSAATVAGLNTCFDGKRRLQAVKASVKAPKVAVKATVKAPKVAIKAKAPKVKVSVKAPKVKTGLKIKVPKVKAGLKIKVPKVKAGLKIKVGAKAPKVKVTVKKVAKIAKLNVNALGWSISNAKDFGVYDSFKVKNIAQAPAWTGKVTSVCKNSSFVKGLVIKLVTSDTAADIEWSQKWWQGPVELNKMLGYEKKGRFNSFMGKKLLNIKAWKAKIALRMKAFSKKMSLKFKAGSKKFGLKVKAGANKFAAGMKKFGLKIKAGAKAAVASTKKFGLKVKAGAKKFGLKVKAGAKAAVASTKKFGLKVKAGAKAAVAATKKVGLAAKAGFKAGLKVKVAAPKLKVKVTAKKSRRMQAVASTGVDLNSPTFAAAVTQPSALGGDGQSDPVNKSWVMFAGLMSFVAVLLQ